MHVRRAAVYTAIVIVTLGTACGAGHSAGARTATARSTAPDSFVFAAEAVDQTTYWIADAVHPSVRQRLLSVSHRANWAGNASVSPDRRWLAYSVLPAGALDPGLDAQLWLAPLQGGVARRMSGSVDVRGPLVWAPDSQTLVYQRVAGQALELWRAAIPHDAIQLLARVPANTPLIPIGYGIEGIGLWGVSFQPRATLVQIEGAGVRVIATLAGTSQRDFVFSPDRARLAYLAQAVRAGRLVYEARLLDLRSQKDEVIDAAPGGDVGVAWRPDGQLLSGSAGSRNALRLNTGANAFPSPPAGFDVPLGWSPSGMRLAVREFSGSSAEQPGSAREVIIEPDGTRRQVTDSRPVRFVGWLG